MPHQRKVIRDAIVAKLVAAATAAGARVYPDPVLPQRKSKLPAVLVHVGNETVADSSASTAPRELERLCEFDIDVLVGGMSGEVSDDLEALALEVETVMHEDPHLAGAVCDLILSRTEIDFDIDGDRVIGMARLTYDVTYYTLAPEPPADASLDDFVQVGAGYNLGNEVNEDDQASDLFTVEEA